MQSLSDAKIMSPEENNARSLSHIVFDGNIFKASLKYGEMPFSVYFRLRFGIKKTVPLLNVKVTAPSSLFLKIY
jgi:hypothetical protein